MIVHYQVHTYAHTVVWEKFMVRNICEKKNRGKKAGHRRKFFNAEY